jgi:hypothetical protein
LVLPSGGKSKPGQVLSTTHRCRRRVLDIPSTYLLTYLLTPYRTALLEKLTRVQVVTKFPAFYVTRRFIIAFTVSVTCPCSEPARSSHASTSHFLKINFNIILPFTRGSPKWSLTLRFPHQNPVYASPLHHHTINRTWKDIRSQRVSPPCHQD